MAGRLTIREDDVLPPGWVTIGLAAPTVPDAIGVTITRRSPSEKPHLGPQGWQSAAFAFPPRQMRAMPDGMDLVFGPEVTAHLVVDMDVTVGIPALGLEERHFWPDISHGVAVALPPLPSAPARPAPPPPPLPVAAPAPSPQENQPGIGPDPGGPAPPDKNRPFRWRGPALAVVALLLVAAITTLVLAPLGGRDHPSLPLPADGTVVPPQAQAPPTQASPDLSPSPQGPAGRAAPAGPQGFAQRYEQLLRGGGQADQLLALGREAMAARETDAGFNAIALAADRGSAAAKFLLGEWYDPLRPRTVPLTPDAAIAAAYYQDAGRSGHAPANGALTRLCAAARDPATLSQEAFATFDPSLHCQTETPR